jgi:20S proteasome alpha/beta subunit
VTIIIGFACEDGIVLASDSQLTYPDGTKVKPVKKLFQIDFKNGSVGVAFTGYVEPATTFIELFQERARNSPISHFRTVADIAEEGANVHQRMMLKECSDRGMTRKQKQSHLAQNSYTVLLATYFEGVPHLFELPSFTRKAVENKNPFIADGGPHALARFFSEGIDIRRLPMREALPLAAFIVNACIEFDSYCDRPLQMAILSQDHSEYMPIPKIMVKAYEGAAKIAREDIQHNLSDELRQRFDAYAAQHLVPESAKKKPTSPNGS